MSQMILPFTDMKENDFEDNLQDECAVASMSDYNYPSKI